MGSVLAAGRSHLRTVLRVLLLVLLVPALQVLAPSAAQAAGMSGACADINAYSFPSKDFRVTFSSLAEGEVISWQVTRHTADWYNTYIEFYNPYAGLYADTGSSYPAAVTSGTHTAVAGSDLFVFGSADSAPSEFIISCAAAPAAVTVVMTPSSGALSGGVVGTAYSEEPIGASGGTGTTTFALNGDLPPGVHFDTATGEFSGTPTLAGDFAFDITATDGGSGGSGETATAHYSIKIVNAASFSPAAGTLRPGMVGEPFSLTVNPGTALTGVTFSIPSGVLPDGLTLDTATGVISGMPTIVGPSNFTVATSGTTVGSAAYSLAIVARAVTAESKVSPPIAPGSTPLPVDLTVNATGGPFTAAHLVSVNPIHAGTAIINMGDMASTAPLASNKFYLKFIPNPTYSGSAVVSYALTSPLGTSNTATVTYSAVLNVPVVEETFGVMGKSFAAKRQGMIASSINLPGLSDRRNGPAGGKPVDASLGGDGGGMILNFSSSLNQVRAGALTAADDLAMAQEPLPFDIWIDGTLALHQDGDDGQWGHFSMVSIGADYLVNDDLLVGVALLGDTMVDPSRGGSTRGTGFMIGPYLSSEIAEGIQLDLSTLYGQSRNTAENGGFTGDFGTQRLLVNARLEGQWVEDALTLRPNLNFVLNQEVADGYVVTNAIGDKVAIAGFTTTQIRIGVGGSASYAIALENGATLTPGVSAGLGSTGDWSSLFANVYGSLGSSLTLSGQNWSLGTTLTLDADTSGARAVSARGSLGVQF